MYQYIDLFGKTINLYDTFNNLGFIFAFLWYLFHLKDYKEFSTISRIPETLLKNKNNNFFFKWFFVFIEVFFVFFGLYMVSSPVAKAISLLFLGDQSANYFVNIFLNPIALLLLGVLLKISPLKLLDFAALPNIVALIFYKIACFCWGCCYGVPTEKYGLMNKCTNRVDFPVQLVEVACAVVMFIIILLVRNKKNRTPGLLYPLFMLMYCGSRFISEFWRDDYPDVWGPLKGYHIQCIVGFVMGLILLAVSLKWGKQLTEYFETKNKNFLERVLAKKTNGNASTEKTEDNS